MPTRTINEAFTSAFGRIRALRTFVSTPGTERAGETYDEACIKAAISKCIDFNVIVNRERKDHDEAFLLLSGLRGIVEELIALKYSLRFTAFEREQYFNYMMLLNRSEGILAQKQFFEANNPFQFVVGSGQSIDQAKHAVEIAKNRIQTFWKSKGSAKKNGPNIRDMAEAVQLRITYEYIYFAASNFVHFNPHALMRTGWGPEGGPFAFSVGNFGGCYRDLAAFYGAIVYIGFASTFGFLFPEQNEFDQEVGEIEDILVKTPRWPELVTFEELNLPVPPQPQRPILHAVREGAKTKGGTHGFDAMLREVKGHGVGSRRYLRTADRE